MPHRCAGACALALAMALTGCGGGDGGQKSATQVAVKVNKNEISVHQINHVLQRQAGLKPEQVPVASKRILETLIDQELAIQQAVDAKLDREPNIVMAIEAAKRDILAKAYIDKVAGSAAKATDEEIAQYYASKPALFAQRRLYGLQEFGIEGGPDTAKTITPIAQAAKNAEDLRKQLAAANLKFSSRVITQPAEALPLNLIDRIAALNEGQSLAIPTPNGVNVVFVNTAKSQPVTLEQAKPAIEQFLLNERKRKILGDEAKRLRDGATIAYQGQFAAAAASAAP
jgi:EpsD family peptidyl-prolyl cis-trans isomerase